MKRLLLIPPKFTLPCVTYRDIADEETQKVRSPNVTCVEDVGVYDTFRMQAVTLTSTRIPRWLLLVGYIIGVCGVLVAITLSMLYLSGFRIPFVEVTMLIALCILISTLASNLIQRMTQEKVKDTFVFRQSHPPISSMKRGIEYLTCIAFYVYSLYVVTMAVLVRQGITFSFAFYVILGFVYSILLRPNFLKRIVWMVVAPWVSFNQFRKTAPTAKQYHPLVSVIIAARNEEVGIASTMQSIMQSEYEPLEVIVITNGCTDSTPQRVDAFIHANEKKFRGKRMYHYSLTEGGKSGALNVGILHAQGELIVTTDADVFMHPRCIQECVSYMGRNESVMGMTGNHRVGNIHSLLGCVQAIEYALSRYTLQTDALFDTIYVMSGMISCFRREVFMRIGLFHVTNTTEDLEMTMRMHKAGMKIGYCPGAIAYTETPFTWYTLFRQRLRWVRGSLDAFKQHSDVLFSNKHEHSKLYSWITLPLIRFNQFSILIQLLLRIGLIVFSMVTHTYTTLATACILNGLIIGISVLSVTDYPFIALLSPIAWLLLEIPGSIYTLAFIVAWWDFFHKKQRPWQKWERQGIQQ